MHTQPPTSKYTSYLTCLERERDRSPSRQLGKCVQWFILEKQQSERDQAEPRSRELHTDVPRRWEKPKCLDPHCHLSGSTAAGSWNQKWH